MYCPNCGEELPIELMECLNCRAAIRRSIQVFCSNKRMEMIMPGIGTSMGAQLLEPCPTCGGDSDNFPRTCHDKPYVEAPSEATQRMDTQTKLLDEQQGDGWATIMGAPTPPLIVEQLVTQVYDKAEQVRLVMLKREKLVVMSSEWFSNFLAGWVETNTKMVMQEIYEAGLREVQRRTDRELDELLERRENVGVPLPPHREPNSVLPHWSDRDILTHGQATDMD